MYIIRNFSIILFLILSTSAIAIAQSELKESYNYDDAGRLISVEYGNGTSISYSYDPAGNLLRQISKGVESSTTDLEIEVSAVSVSPNPTTDDVSVKFSLLNSAQINVELCNALGELEHIFYRGFLNQGEHEFSLSTESYVSGLYYLKLESANYKHNRKLVIIR